MKGKWKAVDLTTTQPEKKEEWNFYNGGQLSITVSYRDSDSLFVSVTNNGTYKMTAARRMIINGFTHVSMQYYNTSWEIVDLTKERLSLVNDQDKSAGLYFAELMRVQE